MSLITRPRGMFGVGGSDFPDPFNDMSSMAMPQTLRSAMQYCEYIYMMNGTYRMAMERVLSYFLTEIEIGGEGTSDEEEDKWLGFMNDTLGAMQETQNSLSNKMCYGNDYVSLLVPFKRFLRCPKCKSSWRLRDIATHRTFGFKWQNYEFHATCPVCKTGSGYSGKFQVDDKPEDLETKLKLKHWSVHEIELLHDPYTDDVAYLWRIPEDYKQMVRKGNLYHLERVTKPVLEAIKHNQMFRFNDDVIYHMKEPVLSGIRNRGWGIPRILSNFRQLWYVQVLHRYNEAIAMDYVIPFRLITPAPRQGSGAGGGLAMDSLMTLNMGDFRSQVNSMVRRRRRDPAGWNVLPFPVQYQALGGDATQLAPRDLIDQGLEQLLNDAGTPVELYKGSLQLQTAPVALRLFEATWHHLVHDANRMLQWLVKQVSQIMSWEAVDAKLKRVTIADDINKQMAALQLMMGQQLSGTTALKTLGFSWKEEQKRLADETRTQAELQARTQEEMDQAGFAQEFAKGVIPPGAAAGVPAGGAPAGGQPDPAAALGGGAGGAVGAAGMPAPVADYIAQMNPSTPQTPEDMLAAADTLADQMLGLPEGVKDSELRKLKQHNEVLHSLVRARMDQKRREARMQGGAALMQQQGGGQA